jgi:hypothetical protein
MAREICQANDFVTRILGLHIIDVVNCTCSILDRNVMKRLCIHYVSEKIIIV